MGGIDQKGFFWLTRAVYAPKEAEMNADSDGARAAAKWLRQERMQELVEDREAVVCIASGCPFYEAAETANCAACTAGLALPAGISERWLETWARHATRCKDQ